MVFACETFEKNIRKKIFDRNYRKSVIEIAQNYRKFFFHHYELGEDSDAENHLSLSSLVLSEQIPLTVGYQKNDLIYISINHLS